MKLGAFDGTNGGVRSRWISRSISFLCCATEWSYQWLSPLILSVMVMRCVGGGTHCWSIFAIAKAIRQIITEGGRAHWGAGVLIIIMLLTLITLPWILVCSFHFRLTALPPGVEEFIVSGRRSFSRDEHRIPGITDLIRSWGVGNSGGVKLLHSNIRHQFTRSTCHRRQWTHGGLGTLMNIWVEFELCIQFSSRQKRSFEEEDCHWNSISTKRLWIDFADDDKGSTIHNWHYEPHLALCPPQ